MTINSKELEQYLRASLSAIKKGVESDGDFLIRGPIEFTVAVTNVSEKDGGLKIYVVTAKGKLKSEHVSHIKILVDPKEKIHVLRPPKKGK